MESSKNPDVEARSYEAATRTVELLVVREGDAWEMRCGHCGKIERYASEKEALDAAEEHQRSLGLNLEPRLRLDDGSGEARETGAS